MTNYNNILELFQDIDGLRLLEVTLMCSFIQRFFPGMKNAPFKVKGHLI
jgi:hypothetical protein